jgi:uncharacterized protein YaiE (UPF0345 family)
MESKKINQLATELTPALSDLTIIGDPTTGISKKITLSQMASLFTGTVEEYANVAAFPLVGVADTIYIALDTNVLYRWNTGTSAYVELSPNIINSLVFSDANGFDGNISLVGSVATLTITTALTTGSVGFIGASGALLQDNANFFWDDTNNRLGLGTNAPTTALDVFGSGIIGRINGTSTNNAFLGFASAGSNKWSIGNVQSDHRFRIYSETNTAELVSVLQTGEFGIGIANPTTKFHIDGAASALIANLDANVSVAKSVSFRSDNSNRFNIEVSGTESGSNAGADFFIRRYSDAGALIDTPLTITRSTGVATFGTSIVIGSGASNQSLNIYGSSGVGLQIFETSSGNNKRLVLTQDSTSVIYNATFGTGPNQHVFQIGNTTKLTIGDTNSTFTNNIIGTSATFSGTVNGLQGIFKNSGVPAIQAFRDIDVSISGSAGQGLEFGARSGSTYIAGAAIYGGLDNPATTGTLVFQTLSGGALGTRLSIAANGEATFTNTIIAKTAIINSGAGNNFIGFTQNSNQIGYVADANWIFGGSLSDFGIRATNNLVFGTGFTEKLRITNGGNVLIGTTTDNGSKLNVNGNTTINTGAIGANISLDINNTGTYGIVAIRRGTQTNASAGINFYTTTTHKFFIGIFENSDNFGFYNATNGTFPMIITTGNNVTILTLAGSGSRAVLADSNGTLSAPVSDISVKQNIKTIGYGLNEILKMNPVWFDFIDEYKNYGEGRQNGNIAQEMQMIIPEAVFVTPSTGKMGINYDQMHAVYIKAIQELKLEIDKLKNK